MSNEWTLDRFLEAAPGLALAHQDILRRHDGDYLLKTESRIIVITVQNGLISIGDEEKESYVSKVATDDKTLLDLLNGKMSAVKAILFGKIRINGDAGELIALLKAMS